MLTHEEYLELAKIMSDFFKQMITLDTGVMVLMVTIIEKVFTTEKVFKNGLNQFFLLASVGFLTGSLLFALRALVIIPTRLTALLRGGFVDKFVDSISLNATIYLFLFGVISFIALVIITMYSNLQPARLSANEAPKQS